MEAQEAASKNVTQMLFHIIRDLTGHQTKANVSIRNKNGKILLDKKNMVHAGLNRDIESTTSDCNA